MTKKYEISEEGLNEFREARKTNRDKSVERRLHALILHAEGNTGKKISEVTGYNEKYLYELYRKDLSGGIEAITGNHYGGNRRNMSYEEEEIFLSQFINEADGGHITDVKAIKAAYDKKVGHETGHGQIYTVCMNIFLENLSAAYPDDYIILVCDGPAWHKSGSLQLFQNIELMFIPPYTPEMNPIEQSWKELRARGFHNEVFQTLDKVVDRLCDTISSLTCETIRSITGRSWILSCFR